jgi:hypothetical protein
VVLSCGKHVADFGVSQASKPRNLRMTPKRNCAKKRKAYIVPFSDSESGFIGKMHEKKCPAKTPKS